MQTKRPTPATDVPDRLLDVVRFASRSSGGARVTLHLRRARSGRFELAATSDDQRFPPDSPLSVPLLERVLESEAPVVVTDGSPDRVRVVTRVLGWSGDVVGIVAFESVDRPDERPPAVERPALQRIGALAAVVAEAVAAVNQAQELARANGALRTRTRVDRRLAEVTRAGGGLNAVVREVAQLTGKVVTLFDHGERQLTSAYAGAGMPARCPAIKEILAACRAKPSHAGGPFVVPSGGPGGLSRRKVVAPVVTGDEIFGWLVIDEHPTRFTALDTYAAQRASADLSSELLVQRRVARMAWNARSALARSMVRGTQTAQDLVASAEYLGVDPSARRVLAYVLEPSCARAEVATDQALAGVLERDLGVEVLTTRGSEGVLLVIESPAGRGTVSMVQEVKAALAAATARICGPGAIVGISTVCEPTALARGYREAREVAHCIDRFAGRAASRVLAVDDLGPARLFLANSDTSAIRAYVADVLGPLLTSEPGMADLLITLQCYFDASRSVRTSAARLGVHENTIRLRLARVATATGLDVAGDAHDQLSVQTALLVLRLQGHPTLDAVGADNALVGVADRTDHAEPGVRHTDLAPRATNTERKTA